MANAHTRSCRYILGGESSKSLGALTWKKSICTNFLPTILALFQLQGLEYEAEISFSRRHPFEPPVVRFPPSHERNLKNPRPPNVDGEGKLWLRDLSHDWWSPIKTVGNVIAMIVGIFSIDPPTLTFTCDDHSMARAQQCREQQQLVYLHLFLLLLLTVVGDEHYLPGQRQRGTTTTMANK